jgi:hypothetical protein
VPLTFTTVTRDEWLEALRAHLAACDPQTSRIDIWVATREDPSDPSVAAADAQAGMTITITLNGGAGAAQYASLSQAIRKYGVHEQDCQAFSLVTDVAPATYTRYTAEECTCGFAAVLDGLGLEPMTTWQCRACGSVQSLTLSYCHRCGAGAQLEES